MWLIPQITNTKDTPKHNQPKVTERKRHQPRPRRSKTEEQRLPSVSLSLNIACWFCFMGGSEETPLPIRIEAAEPLNVSREREQRERTEREETDRIRQ